MHKYNVTLIPYDLRREETIQQYADELGYLENISKDMFQRLVYYCSSNFLKSPF